jgi:hypothetical protein
MEIDLENMLNIATSVIATAAVVAAVTPNKWDNIVVKVLRTIVDTLALNVGNAKNKD